MDLKEIKRNKLKNWSTFQPLYPDHFKTNYTINEILNLENGTENVCIAGRITIIRQFGKITFIPLKNFQGTIQIILKEDVLEPKNYEFFINNLDIGDLIGIKGTTFLTKTNEKSIIVNELTLLSKTLLPFPEKWHGIVDEEIKLRKRYLDLIINDDVKDRFLKRIKIIQSVKDTLNAEGFLEVETPILQTIASGAMANPFKTHHNALNLPLYLRIAPEIYLKQLIIGGFEKIYEIGKNFRNEGIDTSHLQEFTMLEYYAMYWNYHDSIKFVKKIFQNIFNSLNLKNEIEYLEHKININVNEWETISYRDLVYKYTKLDLDILLKNESKLKAEFSNFINIKEYKSVQNMIDALYKKHCRVHLINPTIITNQPSILGPLARKNSENSIYSDRFQIVIAGLEVVNAYSELVDPILQKQILLEQQIYKHNGEEEFMEMDDNFIEAMEYGMPPTSGLGLGIDRIVAILTNSPNLKEVIFFPNVKKEK